MFNKEKSIQEDSFERKNQEFLSIKKKIDKRDPQKEGFWSSASFKGKHHRGRG
jgi:hypothetical protein